ncbi:VCBS repeat-containing protein [Bradyrhizobium japonicum USDA 38]|uniref:VCBS domain-containing protein n=1 Tax=Bradyrhizobium japonicum TaxID=375 RepID=UPI0004043541|nr:VCBS domain-containing protein [Bradyrhizobium japonicum]MCS3892156.1 VCBS repeat-containing protein [Bradyrhizobium japonicum USDA 38]MCS3944670.1 VCBS repeat-containing protein [Bradyrhizobium japonicum]
MTNSAPVFTAACGSDDSVTRVSTSATGVQADDQNHQPVLSADGTKVAFESYADNLVPGDTNGAPDIFVKDLTTGAIALVSTNASGVQGDSWSYQPVFSPDGTKLAFSSASDNLVPGDTNQAWDVFVKDLTTGAVTRVSTSVSGAQADGFQSTNPIFSPDGTKVAFYSDADNLVPDDTDHLRDIFVKDLTTGAITLVGPSPYNGGAGTNGGDQNGFTYAPSFSPDGTKIVFGSATGFGAGNDIYIKDLATGVTTLVSDSASGVHGNGGSYDPVFSPDGTKVAFYTFADNLVPGSSNIGIGNIVIKDLTTGVVTLVSANAGGAPQNNGEAQKPVFSPDGTKIAFYSAADNLVPGVNGYEVYVKDLITGAVTVISTSASGMQANGYSQLPGFSADGTKLVFESSASNLVPGDTNGTSDIFVKDIAPPSVTKANLTDNGATHVSTSGAVFFTDADKTDTHTASVASQSGNLGTLTATVDDADGKVTWSYDVSHANIAPLRAGQIHADTFTLTLDDGHGGSATQSITVTLTGIDDGPVIHSATTASFAENGTDLAYHIAATDVDSPTLFYSLSGTDAALFNVSIIGDVTFKSAPDFEAPKDANHDNVYDVTVAVSDGTEITTKNVAITVTDVNDTSGGGGVLTVTGSTGFTSIDRATINISVTGNLHETGSAGVISNSTINDLGSLTETQAMLAFVNDTIAGGSIGAIVAHDGTITFDNVHLDGMSLDATSGGLIESVAGSTNTFNNVTLKAGAVFDDSAGSVLNVSGALNNSGTIELFNAAKVVLTGDATVIGNGEIKLDPGSSILNSGGHHTLDLEGGTIDGAGTIGNGDHSLTLAIGFSGTLEANGSQPLAVNTGNSVTSNGLIEAIHASLNFNDAVFNTFGTITADQGGMIDFKNGLTNGGIVNVHTGSEVDVSGNLVNNGTVLDSGVLKVDNLSGTGAVNVNNGTLVVTGNLGSNVVLTGTDSFVFGPDAKQTSGVISNYTPGTTLVLDGFDTKVNVAFDTQTNILTLTDADHHAMTLHLAPGSLIPQAHGAPPDFLV